MSKQMKSVVLPPEVVEAINQERRRTLKSFSAILGEWAAVGAKQAAEVRGE